MTNETKTDPGRVKTPPAPSVQLEHVEWRIDSHAYRRGDGATCRWVPYLSAARVMMIMDDWVGPDRWRVDGYDLVQWGKDGLQCTISVYFNDVGWVSKMGAGNISSSFEAVKSNESDAFRRCAGRVWGAGRNVYELPTLWAPCRFKDGVVDHKGNLKALGSTRDTEHALLNELKAQGITDAVVRISRLTEGEDEFGEGPTGQIIPDTSAERAEEVQEASTKVEAVQAAKPVVAAAGAVSAEDCRAMLGKLTGPLPIQAKRELDKAGLWPVGKDSSATVLQATASVLQRLLEAQTVAEAA